MNNSHETPDSITDQKACSICFQNFSLLRRKIECSSCQALVCKQDSKKQKNSTIICLNCDKLNSEDKIRRQFNHQIEALDEKIAEASSMNERLAREQMNKTSELNQAERQLQRTENECSNKEKEIQHKGNGDYKRRHDAQNKTRQIIASTHHTKVCH